jgi:UDP-N-acetylmuramyl pentapeptide phosphotransferase/UDP-N-acetylglucosamine-1-phosphate transferase
MPIFAMFSLCLFAYGMAHSKKKWKTLGYSLLAAAATLLLCACIGFLLHNFPASGTLAGIMFPLAGGIASVSHSRSTVENAKTAGY